MCIFISPRVVMPEPKVDPEVEKAKAEAEAQAKAEQKKAQKANCYEQERSRAV